MARSPGIGTQPGTVKGKDRGARWHGSLDADIIIANAAHPLFVSDLVGKMRSFVLVGAERSGGARRGPGGSDVT